MKRQTESNSAYLITSITAKNGLPDQMRLNCLKKTCTSLTKIHGRNQNIADCFCEVIQPDGSKAYVMEYINGIKLDVLLQMWDLFEFKCPLNNNEINFETNSYNGLGEEVKEIEIFRVFIQKFSQAKRILKISNEVFEEFVDGLMFLYDQGLKIEKIDTCDIMVEPNFNDLSDGVWSPNRLVLINLENIKQENNEIIYHENHGKYLQIMILLTKSGFFHTNYIQNSKNCNKNNFNQINNNNNFKEA